MVNESHGLPTPCIKGIKSASSNPGIRIHPKGAHEESPDGSGQQNASPGNLAISEGGTRIRDREDTRSFRIRDDG